MWNLNLITILRCSNAVQASFYFWQHSKSSVENFTLGTSPARSIIIQYYIIMFQFHIADSYSQNGTYFQRTLCNRVIYVCMYQTIAPEARQYKWIINFRIAYNYRNNVRGNKKDLFVDDSSGVSFLIDIISIFVLLLQRFIDKV